MTPVNFVGSCLNQYRFVPLHCFMVSVNTSHFARMVTALNAYRSLYRFSGLPWF